MFGNKNGWIIAVAVLGLEVWLVWFLMNLDTIQRPSRGMIPKAKLALDLPEHPEFMEEIKLPFDPLSIMPSMTKQQDAAPMYRKALELYMTNVDKYESAYDKEKKQWRSTNYKDYPGLQELVDARECAFMNLYQSSPEKVIDYRGYPEGPTAFYNMGKLANQLAFLVMKDKPDESKALCEAVYSLGVKMIQERMRFQEFDNGQRIMREAALTLARLADPDAKKASERYERAHDAYMKATKTGNVSKEIADEARAADAEMKIAMDKSAAGQMDVKMRDLIRSRLNPMWHIIGSVDQDVIGPTGGDVFYTVKNSKERMWRIEGILKLGRYKYDVGIPGHGPNQKWARLWCKRIANDKKEDPAVRTAAKIAHELTLDDFRAIGS